MTLICADSNDYLWTLPKKSVHMIMTSPPYNLGKEYEIKNQSLQNYIHQIDPILDALVHILHPQGSLCWQVGNYVYDGEVFPLDAIFYYQFKRLGLRLRNRIIWRFGHGLHASKRFSGRYETILWFTKSDDYTFNLDSVRVPSKYPNKKHYKGPHKGEMSGNPLGKNPSDIWEVTRQDWEQEVWDIPNVKHNHAEKTNHPCQYPIELVERCVLALTNEGDTVLDPFMGVGSTVLAAEKHGRKGIGIEKEQAYVTIAQERLQMLRDGTLKMREMGPVYQPGGIDGRNTR